MIVDDGDGSNRTGLGVRAKRGRSVLRNMGLGSSYVGEMGEEERLEKVDALEMVLIGLGVATASRDTLLRIWRCGAGVGVAEREDVGDG